MILFSKASQYFLMVLLNTTLASYLPPSSDCTWNDIELWGRVQVVDTFPDIKVQVVTSFPELKVLRVDAFASTCGKWELVDSFPDFTIQLVESFPDLKIQYVEAFPGIP